MPHARVNQQTIYFEDTGGPGPAIVFSHGLLMDGSMFAPQVDALRSKYRCITWDERAHGKTAEDECAPFSYYDSADDLAALLDHLQIRRAVLAGMSQGGYLSLRCALTHPSIVRALVLIDTQALPEDPEKTAAYGQLIDMWLKQGLPEALAETIAQIILGKGWEGTDSWKSKWRNWKAPNLQQAFTTLGGRDDISDRIRTIGVPALIIHGDRDVAIDLERARSMATALTNSHFVVIPGAGHAANLTNPAQVNPHIEEFLGRLVDDSPGTIGAWRE